jgi:hypothetical protein
VPGVVVAVADVLTVLDVGAVVGVRVVDIVDVGMAVVTVLLVPPDPSK